MKIDTLRLIAFGPFTNRVLDFSGDGYGLNIVYGANEAGKSTALRALRNLFYGFPHQVTDAWFHESKKLAVGAVLAGNGSGERLHLTRHKRRKNDLIDMDTGQPVDPAVLDALLGHLGRETFEHAFGISHDSLRSGVESVLAAGGNLGHALFAATSGLHTLKQVVTRLDDRQSGLFAPRKHSAAINSGITELNKLRKKQREASASHLQWKKIKTHLDQLQNREAEGNRKAEELDREISQLSRYDIARKYVPVWDQLHGELAEIGSVPQLPDDFSERRVAAQVAIKESIQAVDNLETDLDGIHKKQERLSYDSNLIANEELIAELADNVNVHRKEIKDSKRLRAEIYGHNESAQQALALLRPGLELNSAGNLRLSRPEKRKIQRLGAANAKLEQSYDTAVKTETTAKTDLEKTHGELGRLDTPKDTSALMDCVTRATESGKLEERLSEANGQIAELEGQIDADLAALGLWKGDIFDLEKLAILSDETMRTFENALVDVQQRITSAGKEKSRIQDKIKEKESRLSALTQSRNIPLIEELHSHRKLRDNGWQSVRDVWLEGGDVDPDFLSAFPNSKDLAQAYEMSVSKADRTSDLLRENAEFVAGAETLRSDIRRLNQELLETDAEKDVADRKRRALLDQWKNLWKPLGIEPLTPREMIAWAAKAAELRREISHLRKQRVAADQIGKDIVRITAELSVNLRAIGVDVPDEAGYHAMMDLAGRTLRNHERLREKRLDIEFRIKTLNDNIETIRQKKNEIDSKRRSWSKEWSEAISKTGFSQDSRPEEVNDFILALDDVFSELEKAKGKQSRIDGMQHNRNAYEERVADAIIRLAPDLKGYEPEAAANRLRVRLAKNKERRQEHGLLEKEKRKKNEALSREKEKLAALEETVRLLCVDAGVERADHLPEIEKRASKRAKLEGEFSNVHERLVELAAGQDFGEFADQVKTCDPDELTARLNRLASEKSELKHKLKAIVQEIAIVEKEISSVSGESLAVTLAEEAEGLIGKIQSDVDHYVKLRLASAILFKAIERYRQRNQSPVLAVASEYFRMMTRDSFAGLKADFDDKGDPVIKAVRQDGVSLNVWEMSDGSRDQLFLSLRFGGLRKYVDNNGPMVFIVDDVLVHFDDDRATATLSAMGDLAQRTQIIFFTHHHHLVRLAQRTIADDILQIHKL